MRDAVGGIASSTATVVSNFVIRSHSSNVKP